MYTSIFYCVLKYEVTLLVKAMEGANEEAAVLHTHQETAKEQLPNDIDDGRLSAFGVEDCALLQIILTLLVKSR